MSGTHLVFGENRANREREDSEAVGRVCVSVGWGGGRGVERRRKDLKDRRFIRCGCGTFPVRRIHVEVDVRNKGLKAERR